MRDAEPPSPVTDGTPEDREQKVPAPATVESDSESAAGQGAAAMRVLLIAPDRRFRTVASALLTRRGYAVSASDSASFDLVTRERADVVMIEAGRSLTAVARTVATFDTLIPPVGVVIVADEVEPGLLALPVLPKWGPFEALFAAVERAYAERGYPRSIVDEDAGLDMLEAGYRWSAERGRWV